MKVHEVIMRAKSGEIAWFRTAEIRLPRGIAMAHPRFATHSWPNVPTKGNIVFKPKTRHLKEHRAGLAAVARN
jgi:hypothetical protein